MLLLGQLLSSALIAFASTQSSATVQSKPTTTPIKKGTCSQLSLSDKALDKDASQSLKDFYWAVSEFEQAFSDDVRNQFVKIIHPSIHKSLAEKNEIFDTTKYEFGLAKQKVNRVSLFEMEPGDNNLAPCPVGQIQGVVGPTKQYVAFHDAVQKGQQIRFMTIYAPVAKSVSEIKQLKRDIGLVLLQTQWWSYEQKSPDVLLEESKKLANLNEPLGGWILAESARRLLSANRYFTPNSLAEAQTVSKNLEPLLTAYAEIVRSRIAGQSEWTFLNFAPIYQKDGMEIGLKFRMKAGEVQTNAMLATCKTLSQTIARTFTPYLRKRFRGVECLSYLPEEGLENAPKSGSQFLTWQALGI